MRLSIRLACLATFVLVGTGAAVATTSRSGTTEIAPAPSAADKATFDALAGSATIRYPGVDAVLRATSEADQLAVLVTADRAAAEFAKNPLRPELATAPRVLRLLRYTDVFPRYRNALAWAVIVPDAPVVVYNTNAAGKIQGKCDFVFLVDARTGARMGAFQSCGRRLDPPA